MPLSVKRHVHETVQTEANVYTMIYIRIMTYHRVCYRTICVLQNVLVMLIATVMTATSVMINLIESGKLEALSWPSYK